MTHDPWELEDQRPRYRLCKVAFGAIALSLGLLCFDAGLNLVLSFQRPPQLQALRESNAWEWLVGAPITWLSVLGTLLLVGRWREAAWTRRAGLLLVLNGLDALTWTYEHAPAFGFEVAPLPHGWLRHEITGAFGWVELALCAGLAADVAAHLGRAQAVDAGRTARAFAVIGLIVWGLGFMARTHWGRWPLVPLPFLTLETFLLLVASNLLLCATTFQVTVLCALAARECAQMVKELDHHASGAELLRSRSESEGEAR